MAFARQVFVLLSVLVACWGLQRCESAGKFSFEVHHMFSDTVKQNLGFGDLVPEKGSLEYFKLLAQRDRLIRGRGLSSNNEEAPVTFILGNRTVSIDFLGSDLFWLPCNCGTTCIRDLEDIGLSQGGCSSPASVCPYQIPYLFNTTSTRGTLFEDVLHLVTEDEGLEPVKANITLGCGQNQTGLYRKSLAVNGLLGLGMKDYSVPSVLAKENITANSFSMCFGNIIDFIGRISFGDRGHTDQLQTPLVPIEPNPTYAVNVTEVTVGGDILEIQMLALFDTGTSFTHLLEPAYGLLTKAFDDHVTDKRRPIDPEIPFEFCYDTSPNIKSFKFPRVNMTFVGGSKLTLRDPLFTVWNEARHGAWMSSLTFSDREKKKKEYVLNAFHIWVVSENLMSGYRIVFDRERMILGWKRSDCK
ncbi:hypothetical protein ARALYDRAFT_906483 [Arabidopsis lyrata subsp. lyrata]|uniref:Peptidase A1 domain-containing protein n=1 Tax=Arabidopsis lyrata subsp. lyrata TaxID=81972 RepID=D7LTT9_ARALL|nr:hypothetical protein ARALYDRAFT_906483 [Arabidopsis lyrata subsp. lyrata]